LLTLGADDENKCPHTIDDGNNNAVDGVFGQRQHPLRITTMTIASKIAARDGNETTRGRANRSAGFWPALILTIGSGFTFCVSSAVGEGFRDPPAGSLDLSRAGGRIAQVDDSTAVAQNPANLVDVAGTQLNLTPSIIYFHVNYKSPTGVGDDTKYPWKVLPNFFASKTFHNGDYAIGFGTTVPYGIANEWNTDAGGPFRPASGPGIGPYFTELKTINANPTFSAKLCDKVKLGIGLDVMWSHLRFNQFLNGSPSLEAEAAGSGFGYGANMGVTWQVTERQRLAATYRSPMTVGYSGYFKLTGLQNSSSSFSSQIRFPTIVALGYGIQLTDNILLESDAEWIQFSRFQTLPVNVGSNPIGYPSANVPENWKDTFTIGISGDWKFLPNWNLRGGYQFYESPVPDETLSPTIPDANQNVFTVGINYVHKRHALELAYGLDLYDHRNITTAQNPINGSYSFEVHLLSFSYRYSF
jgi:long-chain fatty acid transport protein